MISLAEGELKPSLVILAAVIHARIQGCFPELLMGVIVPMISGVRCRDSRPNDRAIGERG
jgi:hypothetical protein